MKSKGNKKLYTENERLWNCVKFFLLCFLIIFFIKFFIPQKSKKFIYGFLLDKQCRVAIFVNSIKESVLSRMGSSNTDNNDDFIKLQEENAILKAKIQSIENIFQENSELRKILKMDRRKDQFIVARIIPSVNFEYTQAITINVGAKHKVSENSVVINESGIVGRVIQVLDSYSIVLLSTDVNFNVPVYFRSETNVNNSTDKLAILRGDSSGSLNISTKHSAFHVDEGEKAYSSGHGGVFPQGILVGTVKKDKSISPAFDKTRLKFLCVYAE